LDEAELCAPEQAIGFQLSQVVVTGVGENEQRAQDAVFIVPGVLDDADEHRGVTTAERLAVGAPMAADVIAQAKGAIDRDADAGLRERWSALRADAHDHRSLGDAEAFSCVLRLAEDMKARAIVTARRPGPVSTGRCSRA